MSPIGKYFKPKQPVTTQPGQAPTKPAMQPTEPAKKKKSLGQRIAERD